MVRSKHGQVSWRSEVVAHLRNREGSTGSVSILVASTRRAALSYFEAINSMFRWYVEAGKRYAYLFDVRRIQALDIRRSFAQSAWFTRVWTLQELTAPSKVIFFDCKWNCIRMKKEISTDVSTVTVLESSVWKICTKRAWPLKCAGSLDDKQSGTYCQSPATFSAYSMSTCHYYMAKGEKYFSDLSSR